MVLLRGGSDQAGRRRKEFRSSVRYAPKALFGENIRSCEPFVEAAAKKGEIHSSSLGSVADKERRKEIVYFSLFS